MPKEDANGWDSHRSANENEGDKTPGFDGENHVKDQ